MNFVSIIPIFVARWFEISVAFGIKLLRLFDAFFIRVGWDSDRPYKDFKFDISRAESLPSESMDAPSIAKIDLFATSGASGFQCTFLRPVLTRCRVFVDDWLLFKLSIIGCFFKNNTWTSSMAFGKVSPWVRKFRTTSREIPSLSIFWTTPLLGTPTFSMLKYFVKEGSLSILSYSTRAPFFFGDISDGLGRSVNFTIFVSHLLLSIVLSSDSRKWMFSSSLRFWREVLFILVPPSSEEDWK